MTERAGAVVVGAGVVGLACARAFALRGIDTVILEANPGIGMETSSRNSELVHTGIYYTPGTLKARLCVEGRRRLYEFCASRGVAHRRCGKLIIATRAGREDALEKLRLRGAGNGVDDLRLLSAAEVAALEPSLRAAAALHSPSTGIVDTHGLMLALLGEAEAHGTALALRSPLVRAEARSGGFLLEVGGSEPMRLRADRLVNAAGLHATRVAAAIDGLDARHIPTLHLAKGQYYAYAGRAPFSRLVYPLDEPEQFAVPCTFDLGGQARFGPSAHPVDAIDYAADESLAQALHDGARTYWPALPARALKPAFCGIWPRLSGPGERPADFMVQPPSVHAVPGLVNLFGIDSPGITSSLALAELVADQLAAPLERMHDLPEAIRADPQPW